MKKGQLTLVGLGPGAADLLVPRAAEALQSCDHIVGYSGYLQIFAASLGKARRWPFALGEETDRCRRALELAAEGARVCLVSSGDAGIYATASIACEIAVDEGWRERVEIDCIPGISAMQALSSRVGAPLGHDFCAISLSDLLTPWKTIEKRIRAAGEGDFVVAFYNPRSDRRSWQFARACELLLDFRPPQTAVAIGRRLERPGAQIECCQLGELARQEVDMFTVIIVGNATSRCDGGLVFTPRGYTIAGNSTDKKAS